MRRKLTDEEKMKIQEYANRVESERFPDSHITIIVEDEIDDEGKVHWRAVASKEIIGDFRSC